MTISVERSVTELFALEQLLKTLGTVRQAKLAYMVAKNKVAISPTLTAIRETLKPSPKIMEFEQARERLLEEHARKDARGRAIKTPLSETVWQYSLVDEAAYTAALEVLKGHHPEGVKDAQELEERRIQLNTERETVVLHRISMADIKEDADGNLPISADRLGELLSIGLIFSE